MFLPNVRQPKEQQADQRQRKADQTGTAASPRSEDLRIAETEGKPRKSRNFPTEGPENPQINDFCRIPANQTKMKLTPEQRKKLAEVVKSQLRDDICTNPEFWAEWIMKQASPSGPWMVEYLDLMNRDPESRKGIIQELGFDPHGREES
jgi:hypothetical protein